MVNLYVLIYCFIKMLLIRFVVVKVISFMSDKKVCLKKVLSNGLCKIVFFVESDIIIFLN